VGEGSCWVGRVGASSSATATRFRRRGGGRCEDGGLSMGRAHGWQQMGKWAGYAENIAWLLGRLGGSVHACFAAAHRDKKKS
jgi:hypothetical protein